MPTKTQTLQLKRTVNVPPGEAFRAFTKPTALRDWLCSDAQVNPRKGGRLYLWWDTGAFATGEYTAVEPGKKVAFEWHHSREPEASKIQVSFAPKDGGTQVTLRQTVGVGKKWEESTRAASAAWEAALENLQSVLETGIDLRVARRPMLGVFVGDFSPEVAARIGVPVPAGVRLEGVMDGMGAQAAGLQKDDVLVKMGGKAVKDFATLGAALQGRHGGDRVAVSYYRGAERRTASMELSRRTMPNYPPTPEALAQAAREVYDQVNAEFEKILADISEEQAERRPTPGEWNLKQILAHFIICERDLQSWIAEMLNDNEPGYSLEFRPNVTARLDALIAVHPTAPALMEELKRCQSETVGLLERLPAEFVARRHLYNRLGGWITQVAREHFFGEHRDQIRAIAEVPS